MLHKKEVARKRGMTENEVERILWHGTNEAAMENISRSHFDRGYAGDANGSYDLSS